MQGQKKRQFRWATVLLAMTLSLCLSATGFAADQAMDPTSGFDKDYGTPQYGGILRFAMGEPRSLDPHMETYGNTNAITNNTMNGLLRLSPDMKSVELDMAESIKQIDPLTYEVKIHKGVKFHDVPPVNGRECTSEDVKYSIERVAGKHGREAFFMHRYYFQNKIASIETPDKYTIIFKTTEPYAPFIRYLASPWSMIVPKEAVDKFGDLKRQSVGTGPFILKEYVRGSHISLVRNPDYFKKGKPYLDGLYCKLSADPNANFAAFIAKDYDGGGAASYQRDTLYKEAKEAILNERVGTHMLILRTPPWIDGKMPIKPPFDNIKVRQAVAMAIDKKKLIDLAVSGLGVAAVGPVPPGYLGALTEKDQVKYDPERAKKLLAEAGFPNGFSTTLITWNSPSMTTPVQVLQDMLKQVGINAELKVMEMAQYFNLAYKFNYEMAEHVTTAGCDPEEWLVPYFGDVETSTYYKWSNKEIWAMIKKQSSIMDEDKRMAYIQDIQRKIIKDSPVVSLLAWKYLAARWPWYHRKQYMLEFQTSMHEYSWIDLKMRKAMAGR